MTFGLQFNIRLRTEVRWSRSRPRSGHRVSADFGEGVNALHSKGPSGKSAASGTNHKDTKEWRHAFVPLGLCGSSHLVVGATGDDRSDPCVPKLVRAHA